MYMLGTHLDLCDPTKFFEAWTALGDLDDAECEKMAERLAKQAFGGELEE